MARSRGYYRSASIHGDRIVFLSEDDLWTVSAEGGPARRLTANPGKMGRPVLSPDGKLLAFWSRDEGQNEVWVMDSEGGGARRLTWFGGFTYPAGWTQDGESVIVASDTGQPFIAHYHLHEVPLDGGPTTQMDVGPAMAISHQPGGGGVVIGRNAFDPAYWKRYHGGRAGVLWIDPSGKGNFRKLLDLPGNLASPMWIDGRIYFLSDHEGVGNLYSCRTSGKDLQRHTDHEEFYARLPQTDGARIVYNSGADLWLYDVAAGETRLVDVRVGSARPERYRKFPPAPEYLETYDVHPEGHSLATVVRGKPLTFALWEGAVVQSGLPQGARYRLAKWFPDGKRLAAVTDAWGEEELVVITPGGTVRRLKIDLDIGRAVDLAVSPAKPDRVALVNHRYELIVIDVAKKTAWIADRSRRERLRGPVWSPDGRWIAYTCPTTLFTAGLKLHDTEERESFSVTRPDFTDTYPAFDPGGKYLYFISFREFDPVYDHHGFDLGFPKGSRIMAVTLAKDTPSPLEPEPRAPGSNGPPGTGKNAGKEGEKNKKQAPPRVVVDLEGIEDRVVTIPVPEGTYHHIRGIEGKVLFAGFPVTGTLGIEYGREPPAMSSLECYDLKNQKHETLVSGITDFEISGDAKVLVYRAGSRLRALPAGNKPDPEAEKKQGPSRESGWIDLSRIRLSIDPGEEWAQMFREAWRLQRDHYWVPDMSGTEWKAVHDRYLPLVDRVSCRSELSDLLWEMQGELGTSHCYEFMGDYRPDPGYPQGFFGADLTYDPEAKAWVVSRIPRGDSWREAHASPLAAPGLGIEPGCRILEVGHRKLGRKHPPGEHLVNMAGQRVEVTVADPDGKHKRTVTVKALGSEMPLRYRDWVESNRETVHEETKGQVGYLHIPNMMAQGFAEFHRYYLAELDRPGLLVDVRFNGGGHVSQILLEKLIQRRIGYDLQRWGDPMPYPMQAVAGPIVALTNERAGSDGDIFSHCFKLLGIGPLIGKRTWGGVVGIWPRHALVDGTITSQPEFSFWFKDVGFGVENYGTDPDIEVEIKPQDHRQGRDTQLERGIREAQRLLREEPPMALDFGEFPKLGLPKLPPR